MEAIGQISPVSKRIQSFNVNRLPEQVQLKYKMMATDPFRFFRGTCHLFYEDLSKISLPYSPNSWICGDLHLENFGSFKGDNRLVYFDLNDFDEATLAPSAWELVRMICSIFVGFEALDIDSKKALKCAQQFLQTYTEVLAKGKARYLEVETSTGLVRSFLEKVDARTRQMLFTSRVQKTRNKGFCLISNKKYWDVGKDLKRELAAHIEKWISEEKDKLGLSKVLDVRFRIAGTGSLGVKRYVFLIAATKPKKRLKLLDMKLALPSSLSPFNNTTQPNWASEAERIIAIKYRMQNVSPALQGTTIFQQESFVLQELQPYEDKINFNQIRDRNNDVEDVIRNMALVTASAQLRSSGRQGSAIADELIAFGNGNSWRKDLIDYAYEYAHKVKEDYLQFVAQPPKE